MEITDIRIFPVGGSTQLRAKANVTIRSKSGWEITIKGLRIHDDGKKPSWVGVPTERFIRNGKAEFAEMLWLNQIALSDLYPKVIAAYKQELKL